MIFPVLTTKLHKPQLPDSVISREELLKDSHLARVILVSAQAGSGKSTVVSAWLSKQNRAYCWYSLDDWDNDLMQFFAYLVAGIKPIDEHVSEALEQLLDAFQSIGFEAFLIALINQIHTIKSPFILILDDYHVIRNEQIHQVLRTMLEHFPPSLQLVLITREDPPFPLAKMRASKRLLELRISELRFTEDEVKVYFSQQLHLTLEEAQLQHLIKRTEGWIAGLQMTALSMQGLDDIGVFIEAFTDSHYYIMDYLMEEVLEHHPPEIKTFLLKTSMLEFFSGDLCDAVLQLEAGVGSTTIERLVKTNSFIISADSSHQWYRYHHLFRDLLRQRLDHQLKSELEKLHLRAGLWFKTNGREQEAIHHLLKANAFEEAAALIECKWAEMDIQLQSTSWLDMAKRLPAVIIDRSPVLAMGYGWALLDMGEMEASRAWFDKAQDLYDRCQADACSQDIIISDITQFDLLPATIASAYGYLAAATGDVEGIFTHARDALIRIPSEQYYKRGVVSMLLAIAHWGMGDLHEAEVVIAQSLKSIRSFVNPLTENSFYMVLGELYIQQGALSKAKALFEQTISRVIEQNCVPILLASLYLGLAKIAFLRSENRDAYALLEKSKAYGQRYAIMDWKYKYYLLLSRVYCSEGFYDLARDCIMEGKVYYFMNPLPDEITLEEMEIMIDNAETPLHPDPVLEVEALNKGNRPSFKKEHANQSLSELLTVRELEVLALIVSGLSNQEICDTLFLALSTVKGYNQNIFGKLQVNRRTQAVAKAKELGLV
ncbi:MAG: hypothetical protein CVU84_08845 [Firmicutes bacterium HGW-Firmicutes-1]|jgi:LuxR family maltose regulon positive regulatory protein|nr:MAG: hypothetical protein CVU84_08845 [Firmicutes bacterium HGW-Firmicutes-1]